MAARRQDPPPDMAELLGKFQLENERRHEAFAAETRKQFASALQRVGGLSDEVTRQRELTEGLREHHQQVLDRMATAEREVNTALRSAVEQAKVARDAAQVYERIRDARPDTDATIAKLRTENGALRDRVLRLEEQVTELVAQAASMAIGLTDVRADTRAHQTLLNPLRKNSGRA